MKATQMELMNKRYFSRGLGFDRHIADLDAVIAERRAALIRADQHKTGYIWH